ncbi:MAG: molybdopterin-binding protein [Sphaerochaetaceae bacterium]|nr:molybdopterin-binding protein [Sphaerochaetaceae bacterium]
MKLLRTQDAVGQVLCHDITQIIKGEKKGPVFRKGHIITEEDIPVLLSVGKDHVYIWENDENTLHENDAAEILRQICQGENLTSTAPKEGKIELVASCDGMLKINVEALRRLNSYGQIMCATLPSGFTVKQGQHVAGTRIIPLVIEKAKMDQAKADAGDVKIVNVLPYKPKKVAVITTGNEVYYGRIKDTFTDVIVAKLAEYNSEMVYHAICNDDDKMITGEINKALSLGVDMVICTGGMSVDPDDKTPLAIKNSGANIVSYGSPVLPGAMLLVSYMENGIPVLGLPGCVMYARRTVFDLILPYLFTDTPITADHLAGLGHGGYCRNCEVCSFPNCSFGKGY